MAVSQEITGFQLSCQKYFICYHFAVFGLRDYVKELKTRSKDHEGKLIVGTGHPDEKRWHAAIRIGEAIDSCEINGVFSDKIAKSFITAMYSEWEEVFRPRLALEVGVSPKAVKCDLMGDIRLIRHCIVHNKSIITNEHTKLKQMKWQLSPGPLRITKEMFSELIDQINTMVVSVNP